MKKLLSLLGFILCCLLSAYTNAQMNQTKPEIHIGLNAPITGPFSDVGKTMLEAINMAIDQRKSSKFSYFVEVLDQPQEVIAPEVVNKFIKDKKLSAIISATTVSGLTIAPIAKENNIIHFSIASDPKIADGMVNFINFSPASDQALVLVDKLKQQHFKTVALLTVEHPWSNALTGEIIKRLQNHSTINIAVNKKFTPGTKDFNSIINAVRTANPDAYFVLAYNEDMKNLVEALHAAGINKPMISIKNFNPKDDAKFFEGQWVVQGNLNPTFVQQFNKRIAEYPTIGSGYAYDSFNIIADGFEKTKADKDIPSTQEVSNTIHRNRNGEGVMGRYRIDTNGIIYTPSVVKVIKNGKASIN